ncbi:MAG: nuclear transport factor 2 family protein [Sideroxyarcus sp.]|nr:nuclear transport factor 2 family protein [Sideroxyarcus sp.]
MSHQAQLSRFIRLFETLSREDVQKLCEFYTGDAYFKDPFNEVRGHNAITGIFEHMFKQVEDPGFRVTSSILQDDEAFIVWDFRFHTKGNGYAEQCIRGSSHLRFTADHKVYYHRDYWDAAEELYEKIPVLGSLMRFLKRRVNA